MRKVWYSGGKIHSNLLADVRRAALAQSTVGQQDRDVPPPEPVESGTRPALLTFVGRRSRIERFFDLSVWRISKRRGNVTAFTVNDTASRSTILINVLIQAHHTDRDRQTRGIEPPLQHLSDTICFVADTVSDAISQLVSWVEVCRASSPSNIRVVEASLPRCRIYIRQSGHPGTLRKDFERGLSETTNEKYLKTMVLQTFDCLKVLRSPEEQQRQNLPTELILSALRGRADRQERQHLWSYPTIVTLLSELHEQCLLGISEISFSRLLPGGSFPSRIPRMWSILLAAAPEERRLEVLRCLGAALAWHNARREHVFAVEDSFQGLYRPYLTSILREYGEKEEESLLGVYEAMLDAELGFATSPPNRIHFQLLGRSKDLLAIPESTLCLSCCLQVANLQLQCSHRLCETCVRIYADERTLDRQALPTYLPTYEIKSCPFCARCLEHQVVLPPTTASQRIVSIDGGGIRGVSAIVTLEEFCKVCRDHTGLDLPIQAFFDLFVGTSAGGLIALGLCKRQWSLQEARHKFKNLAKILFEDQSVLWRLWSYYRRDSLHSASAVSKAFTQAFGSDPVFLTRYPEFSGVPAPSVAVATTRDGEQKGVITNFEPESTGAKDFCWFQEPGNQILPFSELDTAMCTSSALLFFPKRSHGRDTFWDEAFPVSNPVKYALWLRRDPRDMLMSIGCGKAAEEPNTPRSALTSLLRTAKRETSGDWVWNEVQRGLPPGTCNSIRLDPKLSMETPRLDDHTKLDAIERATLEACNGADGTATQTLSAAAEMARAQLFFPELVSEPCVIGQRYSCLLSIRCRLPDASQDRLYSALSSMMFVVSTSAGSRIELPLTRNCSHQLRVKHLTDKISVALEREYHGHGREISGSPCTIGELLSKQRGLKRGNIVTPLRRSITPVETKRKRTEK